MDLFNATIFNNQVFNTGAAVAPTQESSGGGAAPYYRARPWAGGKLAIIGTCHVTATAPRCVASGRVQHPMRRPDLTAQYIAAATEYASSSFRQEQDALYRAYTARIQPKPAITGTVQCVASAPTCHGEGLVASPELQRIWAEEDRSLLFALMAGND